MKSKTSNNLESDLTLCELFMQGDVFAENLLIERYMPLVRKRANSFRAQRVETDDLVQEGLIGLLSAIRAFDLSYGVAFSTFAYRCITNRMLSSVATAGKNHQELILGSYLDGNVMLLQEDPQKILIDRERFQRWQDIVSKLLSSFEKEAFYLYLSGYTYQEMAASLQSTAKAVDNALQRAKRKLCAPLHCRSISVS